MVGAGEFSCIYGGFKVGKKGSGVGSGGEGREGGAEGRSRSGGRYERMTWKGKCST